MGRTQRSGPKRDRASTTTKPNADRTVDCSAEQHRVNSDDADGRQWVNAQPCQRDSRTTPPAAPIAGPILCRGKGEEPQDCECQWYCWSMAPTVTRSAGSSEPNRLGGYVRQT